MYRCLICSHHVPLDDAIAPTRRGTCICLACYARETRAEKRASHALIREIEDVLAGVAS